jgi:hypothetical protein
MEVLSSKPAWRGRGQARHRVVSSILCKRSPATADFGRRVSLYFTVVLQLPKPCHAPLAGDPQGGGSPLVGGAGARCVPAFLAGRAACCRRGGNPPAPAFPRRGKRERGRSNSLLPQAFPSTSFKASPFRSPHSRYRLKAAWMRSPQII